MKTQNEKFGEFIKSLRKEKNLTQNLLAEKLYITDKAVSKWERGISMPDISLLSPLSQILGVSVAELLNGERISENLGKEQVEKVVSDALGMRIETEKQEKRSRQKWGKRLVICFAVFAIELILLNILGLWQTFANHIMVVPILMGVFAVYFCLLTKETLPAYYDENKISFYSSAGLRMNMAGLSFNNKNWKPILNSARTYALAVLVLYPILFAVITKLSPSIWRSTNQLFVLLPLALGIFIPIYYVGLKNK